MRFPRHITLNLEHNGHEANYESVEDYCHFLQAYQEEWASPEQKIKAYATNECWMCQWYPNTPAGFNRLFAADLDVLLVGLAELAGEEDGE